MNEGYVTGGICAGLVVVAVVGVLLASRGRAIRAALAPFVGERPARWALFLAWFAYGLSALNALASVYQVFPQFGSDAGAPPALAFLYGGLFYPVLAFVNSVVPVLHLAAVVTAAVLLYRHLNARPS